MKTCKTCKWWDEGVCEIVDTIHADQPATTFQIEVKVADDHGLDVKLRTGPDFGCIHHANKDESIYYFEWCYGDGHVTFGMHGTESEYNERAKNDFTSGHKFLRKRLIKDV